MKRERPVLSLNFIFMKKIFYPAMSIILLFIFFSGGLCLYGEQTWQGNAAMIRRGEFETDGFFAASNSFPLNTKILVKNLYNGRTTEVIVIQRLSEYYSVFLLLSEEAAYELGMGEDDVINVEVIVLNFGTGDTIGLPDDLPYNPDPDVFPLPTIPEDQIERTPVPTYMPIETPGPTEEILPEPTPAASEPRIEPSPEITGEPAIVPTPGPTDEITPIPSIAPTQEPTPLALDEKLNRDPQKNLFLQPHEDDQYVLDDRVTPEKERDEDDLPDPEIVNADLIERKAIDGSISTPDYEDKDSEISSLNMKYPEVENPVVEDQKNPEKIASGIDFDTIDEPVVAKKESLIPDPSNEMPHKEDYELVLDPEEPGVPDGAIPDPSYEIPDPEEYEIALDPNEPDIIGKDEYMPDPSYEVPDAREDIEIAMEPEEPDPPTDMDRGKPDPSYEVPDAKDDVDIVMVPDEPDPPTDMDRGKPDPSYDVPDSEEDVVIAMEPEEPEPPAETEYGPDPSNELPEPEEETEIVYNPVDLVVPSETDKDETDEIDKTDETDEIYEPVYGEEDIIITFVETGPKPPPDTGDDSTSGYETEERDDTYREGPENGDYFIQLAAYTEKSPADALKKQYADIYPIKVYTVSDKMIEIYKVIIGPLNKHESDTLLYRFKALGFKDAFVKYSL